MDITAKDIKNVLADRIEGMRWMKDYSDELSLEEFTYSNAIDEYLLMQLDANPNKPPIQIIEQVSSQMSSYMDNAKLDWVKDIFYIAYQEVENLIDYIVCHQ